MRVEAMRIHVAHAGRGGMDNMRANTTSQRKQTRAGWTITKKRRRNGRITHQLLLALQPREVVLLLLILLVRGLDLHGEQAALPLRLLLALALILRVGEVVRA